MSNQLLDEQLWKEAFDFLKANLKDGEWVMLPDEFIGMVPNSYPYAQSEVEKSDRFSWILFHQDRLDQVNLKFLLDTSALLTPVLANAICVIFAKSASSLDIPPDQFQLEDFLTKISELSEAAAAKKRSIEQPKKAAIFDDQFWKDARDFLKSNAHPEENLLLPDEFCPLFPNASSYPQSFTETNEEFNWILLHKDRLSDVNLNFLIQVCNTRSPVFANEVFVLFSKPEAVSNVSYLSEHVRSLVAKIWYLRIKALLENLLDKRAWLQDRSASKQQHQLTLLIERQRHPKDWFTGEESPAFVPLTWAATSPSYPFANLGDALSPITVSALSGLPVIHRNFDSWKRKLACVGTIAHGFKNGAVHFWGTGIDRQKNPTDPSLGYYKKPPSTRFYVHALRGLLTAQTFKEQGVRVPEIYGDPIWFLPAIIKPAATKQYELGVVVHLSELSDLTDTATVKASLLRYVIPQSLSSDIKIITTITQPNFAALEERVKEITACKRIVSTSLHGLVIAETYGIPCACFRNLGKGAALARLDDDKERIDWRIRDFYSGMGLEKLFLYGQRRARHTDWEDLIHAIDTHWQPVEWSPEPFLESFPLPLVFNPLQDQEMKHRSLLEQIQL